MSSLRCAVVSAVHRSRQRAPSNAYLTESSLKKVEQWFPLRVMVCTSCWLVQTEDYSFADDIFKDDYAYFSSYSKTWLDHTQNYVASVV